MTKQLSWKKLSYDFRHKAVSGTTSPAHKEKREVIKNEWDPIFLLFLPRLHCSCEDGCIGDPPVAAKALTIPNLLDQTG